MTAQELFSSYSYSGDIITIVMCICTFFLIRTSLYFSKDDGFILYKRALRFLMVAAVANLGLYYTANNKPSMVWLIYLMRDINHLFLLGCLFIFLLYIRNMLELNSLKTYLINHGIRTIFFVGALADILSPITHFGFYYENGFWYDSTYAKPFTIVYVITVLMLAYMLLFRGEKMISQVRITLIWTEIFVAILLIIQNLRDSNTYTTFTFFLPMIVVFGLLHSKPYDIVTGAMDVGAFSSYLSHVKRKGKMMDYAVLQLKMEDNKEIPKELGRAIYSSWYQFYHNVMLFSLREGTFILAIDSDDHEESLKRMEYMSQEVFGSYYERYHIPFRIMLMPRAGYIENVDDMYAVLAHVQSKAEINSVVIIKDELKREIEENRLILKHFAEMEKLADLDDPFVLAYCQPILYTSSGKYETAEVLMRLHLPEIGLVTPDRFIPLAEQFGYIHMLSRIILNKACKEVRKLLDENYDLKRVSINFSALEFRDNQFNEEVLQIIKSNNIPFDKIAIELTESQNEADYLLIQKRIQELKQYGIMFYLDDFGTGYSNYDRVFKMGMDIIKFDRSLLLCAGEDESAMITMKMFAEALKAMNFQILFEGVETKEQEAICQSCKADYLQGFKFSKPIPIGELREFLPQIVKNT